MSEAAVAQIEPEMIEAGVEALRATDDEVCGRFSRSELEQLAIAVYMAMTAARPAAAT